MQSAGFGLVESLIALVLFSTTLLMIMGVALRQIQQARHDLQSSQLRMQGDAAVLFTALHPHSQIQGNKRCEGNLHTQDPKE